MLILKRHAYTFLFLISCTLQAQETEPFRPIVCIIGTRPEAIKVIPVYKALKKRGLPAILCSTGQHAQMLQEIYSSFQITPDIDFAIQKPGQDLFYISTEVLTKTKELFQKIKPSLVLVQGDTTTAYISALSAFYLHIPIAHVEAGLRTGNIQAPFPEEFNRKAIALIANLHFAPTAYSARQLLKEGISKNVITCPGNTIVDALLYMKSQIESGASTPSKHIEEIVTRRKRENKKLLLLTCHRRESIPDGIRQIFQGIVQNIKENPNLAYIFPMHPNPVIHQIAEETGLLSCDQIDITTPMGYQDLVYTLLEVDGVLTDSGGIQEEALSLKKPLLILRNETDRPEGLMKGYVELVGTDSRMISSGITSVVLDDTKGSISQENPYGDGKASERIAETIHNFLIDQ